LHERAAATHRRVDAAVRRQVHRQQARRLPERHELALQRFGGDARLLVLAAQLVNLCRRRGRLGRHLA
jgi:hypothetical protein